MMKKGARDCIERKRDEEGSGRRNACVDEVIIMMNPDPKPEMNTRPNVKRAGGELIDMAG